MVIPSSAANTFSSADPGFAVQTVDEMLAANADIIARIKLCYGADRESFETDVLALSPTSDTLMLTGNAGDSVTSAGQGWVLQVGETEVEHGRSYDTYTSGLGTLLVDQEMTATLS